jgi:GH25 family lysozyme M1 (1,4-beta-N-acetylmuramidase)
MWGFPFPFFNLKPKPGKAMTVLGIDVSHHNGKINFDEVAKDPQGISYVFIKATEGQTYTDSTLKYNATEAKKAGLRVGYYHFASLNTKNVTEDARAEAKFFVAAISKCPYPDMPVVLDIESNKASVPATLVEIWIRSFFAEISNFGYTDYLLYSYTPFLNANLPSNHTLGDIRLWIAAYTKNPTPKLPIGWNNYHIWQYSAKGKVNGISTDCDMNKLKTI